MVDPAHRIVQGAVHIVEAAHSFRMAVEEALVGIGMAVRIVAGRAVVFAHFPVAAPLVVGVAVDLDPALDPWFAEEVLAAVVVFAASHEEEVAVVVEIETGLNQRWVAQVQVRFVAESGVPVEAVPPEEGIADLDR